MKREQAVEMVRDLLRRLVDGRNERPLSLVTEVRVFGSFARGALQPNDIDLIVRHKRDLEWSSSVIHAMSYGRDPYTGMRRGLTGGKRKLQLLFDHDEELMRNSVLLWSEGDDLSVALSRVDAIEPDETAGRAARDAMLPAFEGIVHWVPRGVREALHAAVASGAVSVEQLTLDNQRVGDERADRHLRRRWNVDSPLARAGHAILAYLEQRGIDPASVHLHGQDVVPGDTPYFAGMQWRYWRSMQRCLTESGGLEWIEIPRPTRTQPLKAVKIVVLDSDKLGTVSW